MTKYHPEDELPESFWQIIETFGDGKEAFRLRLKALEKERLIEMFKYFVLARTEMADVMSSRPEGSGASEDTLDDFADAIVAQGRDTYLETYYEKRPVPNRGKWEELETVGHLFTDTFYDNFGENIYNYIDE